MPTTATRTHGARRFANLVSNMMRFAHWLLNALRGTTTNNTADITVQEAYSILSNNRRRQTIGYLAQFDAGDTVEVGEIADKLSSRGERKALYVSLIQTHLIKMDEIGGRGVIDYNDRAKTVTVHASLHELHAGHLVFSRRVCSE